MKWASVLGMLGLVGCGAVPVPVVDEGPPAGQVNPPQQSPPAIEAGIYSGTSTCDYLLAVGSQEPFESSDTGAFSRAFSDAGLPTANGEDIFVGKTSTTILGATTFQFTIQNIVQSTNGLLIGYDARSEWDCANSCTFAFDGVCDEVNFCQLGTDCFDCGPVVFTGFRTVSYQVVDEQTIRYVSTWTLSEEDDDIAVESLSCEGTLTR